MPRVGARAAGILGTVVLVALTVAIYRPGLGGPLLLDDYDALGPLLELSGWPTDWAYYLFSPTGVLGRPVAMLSFLANLRFGGGELYYWKLTNLALHGLTGALLWALSTRLVRLAGHRDGAPAGLAGLLICGLWLLHPLHVSTVLYTVQRMTQLSALFCTAGLLAYVSGRERQRAGRGGGALVAVAFVLFMPLAALSKETGLLLGVYLAVVEGVLPGFRDDRRHRRLLLTLFSVFLVLPALVGILYYGVHHERLLGAAYRNLGWTPGQRVMTEWRVLVTYLGQIVLPAAHRMGFVHDDVRISLGLFDPPATGASLLVVLALLGSAVGAVRRLPLYACGVLWYFAGHTLESSVFPLELMFEHRNYLPSYGIILALVGLSLAILKDPRVCRVLACALLALLAAVTYSRVQAWRGPESIYAAFYRAHPGSERAASLLAEWHSGQGDHDAALAVLAPFATVSAEFHRGNIVCRRDGALPAAYLETRLLDAGTGLNTATVVNLSGLARLALDDRCRIDSGLLLHLLDAAVAQTITFDRQRQMLLVYAAHLRWRRGELAAAIANLERAHAAIAEDPVPLFLAAEWLVDAGRLQAAQVMFGRARTVARRSRKDYTGMERAVAELLAAAGGA